MTRGCNPVVIGPLFCCPQCGRPFADDQKRAEYVRLLRDVAKRLHKGQVERQVCETTLARIEAVDV